MENKKNMANVNTTNGLQSIQGTVSSTALSLLDFGFTDAELKASGRAFIFVNTNSLRVDWSGNAPTVSVGALISGTFEVSGNKNLYNFQMIRHSTSDSEVFVVLEG
jgi:hypothetical protein